MVGKKFKSGNNNGHSVFVDPNTGVSHVLYNRPANDIGPTREPLAMPLAVGSDMISIVDPQAGFVQITSSAGRGFGEVKLEPIVASTAGPGTVPVTPAGGAPPPGSIPGIMATAGAKVAGVARTVATAVIVPFSADFKPNFKVNSDPYAEEILTSVEALLDSPDTVKIQTILAALASYSEKNSATSDDCRSLITVIHAKSNVNDDSVKKIIANRITASGLPNYLEVQKTLKLTTTQAQLIIFALESVRPDTELPLESAHLLLGCKPSVDNTTLMKLELMNRGLLSVTELPKIHETLKADAKTSIDALDGIDSFSLAVKKGLKDQVVASSSISLAIKTVLSSQAISDEVAKSYPAISDQYVKAVSSGKSSEDLLALIPEVANTPSQKQPIVVALGKIATRGSELYSLFTAIEYTREPLRNLNDAAQTKITKATEDDKIKAAGRSSSWWSYAISAATLAGFAYSTKLAYSTISPTNDHRGLYSGDPGQITMEYATISPTNDHRGLYAFGFGVLGAFIVNTVLKALPEAGAGLKAVWRGEAPKGFAQVVGALPYIILWEVGAGHVAKSAVAELGIKKTSIPSVRLVQAATTGTYFKSDEKITKKSRLEVAEATFKGSNKWRLALQVAILWAAVDYGQSFYHRLRGTEVNEAESGAAYVSSHYGISFQDFSNLAQFVGSPEGQVFIHNVSPLPVRNNPQDFVRPTNEAGVTDAFANQTPFANPRYLPLLVDEGQRWNDALHYYVGKDMNDLVRTIRNSATTPAARTEAKHKLQQILNTIDPALTADSVVVYVNHKFIGRTVPQNPLEQADFFGLLRQQLIERGWLTSQRAVVTEDFVREYQVGEQFADRLSTDKLTAVLGKMRQIANPDSSSSLQASEAQNIAALLGFSVLASDIMTEVENHQLRNNLHFDKSDVASIYNRAIGRTLAYNADVYANQIALQVVSGLDQTVLNQKITQINEFLTTLRSSPNNDAVSGEVYSEISGVIGNGVLASDVRDYVLSHGTNLQTERPAAFTQTQMQELIRISAARDLEPQLFLQAWSAQIQGKVLRIHEAQFINRLLVVNTPLDSGGKDFDNSSSLIEFARADAQRTTSFNARVAELTAAGTSQADAESKAAYEATVAWLLTAPENASKNTSLRSLYSSLVDETMSVAPSSLHLVRSEVERQVQIDFAGVVRAQRRLQSFRLATFQNMHGVQDAVYSTNRSLVHLSDLVNVFTSAANNPESTNSDLSSKLSAVTTFVASLNLPDHVLDASASIVTSAINARVQDTVLAPAILSQFSSSIDTVVSQARAISLHPLPSPPSLDDLNSQIAGAIWLEEGRTPRSFLDVYDALALQYPQVKTELLNSLAFLNASGLSQVQRATNADSYHRLNSLVIDNGESFRGSVGGAADIILSAHQIMPTATQDPIGTVHTPSALEILRDRGYVGPIIAPAGAQLPVSINESFAARALPDSIRSRLAPRNQPGSTAASPLDQAYGDDMLNALRSGDYSDEQIRDITRFISQNSGVGANSDHGLAHWLSVNAPHLVDPDLDSHNRSWTRVPRVLLALRNAENFPSFSMPVTVDKLDAVSDFATGYEGILRGDHLWEGHTGEEDEAFRIRNAQSQNRDRTVVVQDPNAPKIQGLANAILNPALPAPTIGTVITTTNGTHTSTTTPHGTEMSAIHDEVNRLTQVQGGRLNILAIPDALPRAVQIVAAWNLHGSAPPANLQPMPATASGSPRPYFGSTRTVHLVQSLAHRGFAVEVNPSQSGNPDAVQTVNDGLTEEALSVVVAESRIVAFADRYDQLPPNKRTPELIEFANAIAPHIRDYRDHLRRINLPGPVLDANGNLQLGLYQPRPASTRGRPAGSLPDLVTYVRTVCLPPDTHARDLLEVPDTSMRTGVTSLDWIFYLSSQTRAHFGALLQAEQNH